MQALVVLGCASLSKRGQPIQARELRFLGVASVRKQGASMQRVSTVGLDVSRTDCKLFLRHQQDVDLGI